MTASCRRHKCRSHFMPINYCNWKPGLRPSFFAVVPEKSTLLFLLSYSVLRIYVHCTTIQCYQQSSMCIQPLPTGRAWDYSYRTILGILSIAHLSYYASTVKACKWHGESWCAFALHTGQTKPYHCMLWMNMYSAEVWSSKTWWWLTSDANNYYSIWKSRCCWTVTL